MFWILGSVLSLRATVRSGSFVRKHGDLRGEHEIGEATHADFFAQFTLCLVNFVFSSFLLLLLFKGMPIFVVVVVVPIILYPWFELLSDDGYQTIL